MKLPRLVRRIGKRVVMAAPVLRRHILTSTDYKVLDDRSVQVGFDVHRSPDQAVTCTVQAQDSAHGVVGVLEVHVPPSAERSVHQQVVVRTASRAVGGSVRDCQPS